MGKIYWQKQGRVPAEIIEDIKKEKAEIVERSVFPEPIIFVGDGKVFVCPNDYALDGFTLDEKDLRELVRLIQERRNAKLGCTCPKKCNCLPPDENGLLEKRPSCPVHNTVPLPLASCPVHGR